jgi:inhibitor of KinA sporulation pathway (predicted exonuclease)
MPRAKNERKNMATSVYETVELELMDGTKIQMRPLKISLLRDFMDKFAEITEAANDNKKSMDILMECVQIAMKQYNPDLDNKETLEDILDLPAVYKIIEAASGIKFDDQGNAAATGIRGLS